MKAKTINKIITNKFLAWTKTIEDEKIKKMVENGSIITGGCIVSMLLNEDINDFDVYFKNKETALAIAQYYVDQFKKSKSDRTTNGKTKDMYIKEDGGRIRIFIRSSGVESKTVENKNYKYFETLDPGSPEQEGFVDTAIKVLKSEVPKTKYTPIFFTSNAITLSDQIQLIIRFYGNPEEIHKNYDYVHCTNYWTSHDRKLTLHPKALEAIITKELIYTGSLYPICSLLRLRKFIKRGWTIHAGQILKIAYQICDLDLNNPVVLQDQLIGVDIAYFSDLIDKIRKDNKNNIDGLYISKLIDEMY